MEKLEQIGALATMLQGRHHTSLLASAICGIFAVILGVSTAYAQDPVPHPMVDTSLCLTCHREGKNNAPILPEDHADYEGPECTECHAANTETSPEAPQIPHSLVARNDCLNCHARGIGGSPLMPEDHEGRDNDSCQVCHLTAETTMAENTVAAAEPTPTPLAAPILVNAPKVTGANQCVACHRQLEGTDSQVVAEWERGVHAKAGIGCEACHGGDPNIDSSALAKLPQAGFIGVPDPATVPGLCASCHSDPTRMFGYNIPTDQFAKYQESVHGHALYENNDENVATCATCHGAHDVLEVNDPAAKVFPSNVPSLCAGCHADANLMSQYGLASDQYDQYLDSVHGIALLENHDLRAPTCATCHGTHGAAPPGFESVPNVCGSCHSATQSYYVKSKHAQVGFVGPECVTCHGRHDVKNPDESIFEGTDDRHCGSCHDPNSEIGHEVSQFRNALVDADTSLEDARNQVEKVSDIGIIVVREEGMLLDARTQLISARAAQHAIDLDLLSSFTEESITSSQAAKNSATEKQAASVFRRQAMGVSVMIIFITIGALYVLKRDLGRRTDE
jgi:hypothetical protein